MVNHTDDTDPLALINRRKAEMEASRAREAEERARLDAEAAARAKEEEELEIAARVIARLKENTPQVTPAAEVPLVARVQIIGTGSPSNADLLTRYSAGASNAALLMAANSQRTKIPATGGAPRPPNIPTVPQMVLILLAEAEKRGAKGLTSTEIMVGINDRWWPGVAVNLVMPTVYRCISKKHFFDKKDKWIVRRDDGGQPSRRVGGSDLLNLNS